MLTDALVQALLATTDAQTARANGLAERLATGLPSNAVEACKAQAQAQVKERLDED